MDDAVSDLEERPIGARAPDVHVQRRQNFARRALVWTTIGIGGACAVWFVLRIFSGGPKKPVAGSPVAPAKAVTTIDEGELNTAAANGVHMGKDTALTGLSPLSGDTNVFRAPGAGSPGGTPNVSTADPRGAGGTATPGANSGSPALPSGTPDGLQVAAGPPSQLYGTDKSIPRLHTTPAAIGSPSSSDHDAQTRRPDGADPRPLTRAERFRRIGGSIGGLSNTSGSDAASPFDGRRSALVSLDGDAPLGGGTDSTLTDFVPGTRVSATIHTPTPAATSGEPIEAVFDAPLVNRGRVVAPAGTRAIGKGTVFDDGTGNVRLLIVFTQFVLPNDRVLAMTGTSYSVEDNRPGLKVPVNRQLTRKGTRLGVGAGLAYAVGQVATRIASNQSQSAFVEPSVGQQVAGQALQDAYNQARGELGLQTAPTGIVLAIPQDQQLLIVFGIGQIR